MTRACRHCRTVLTPADLDHHRLPTAATDLCVTCDLAAWSGRPCARCGRRPTGEVGGAWTCPVDAPEARP